MTRYTYSQLGHHPAPFVQVSLSGPNGGTELADLPAQLDSGADRTVIPWKVVEGLGLIQLDEITVGALNMTLAVLPTFLVRLTIRQQTPILVEVAGGKNEPWVLLGRDVLNRYRVVLDGPRLALEID
jgi:hypothetical protein